MELACDLESQAEESELSLVSRRTTVASIIGIGIAAALPMGALRAQDGQGPQIGDLLVLDDDDTKTPLTSADIDPESKKTVIAFAMEAASGTVREGALNKILLVKLDPAMLKEDTAARAADGVVAYSAICTHAACEVTGFKPADGTLTCQCHGSVFEATDGGDVKRGPAKHRLASLGLSLDEGGRLVIADVFDGEVGAQA